MIAIIYDDIVMVGVSKLQTLIDARPESYTSDVLVSNRVVEGQARMVTVQFAGGPGELDTLDTSFLAFNVYAPDEGDAADLARMVRALATGRGPGTLCDGDPITYTSTNTGPTPIIDGSGQSAVRSDQFQFRLLIQVQHRGVNL